MSEEPDLVAPEREAPIEAPVVATETKEPVEKAEPKSVLRQQLESARDEVNEEIKKRGNPYKSADGKFTKKPLETKAPETAATEVKEPEAKTETAQQAPQAQEPPKSWSKEKHAIWAALPQEAKDLILSRENQVNEGFAKYQGIEPKYKELDAVLSPLDPMIQGYGTTRGAFVSQLANWHLALSNNPNEAFPALAKAYGFNLTGSPAADYQQEQPNVLRDPRVDQIMPTLAQLQQAQADAIRREAEAQMRQTSEHVANWAKDKPHYEKARHPMGLLIKASAETGREMSLDEAYEKAIWGIPEIREQLMKDRFTAEQKANAEAATKAKLAAVSVTSRSPAGPSNGVAKDANSIRAGLKAAIAQHQGAGRA